MECLASEAGPSTATGAHRGLESTQSGLQTNGEWGAVKGRRAVAVEGSDASQARMDGSCVYIP